MPQGKIVIYAGGRWDLQESDEGEVRKVWVRGRLIRQERYRTKTQRSKIIEVSLLEVSEDLEIFITPDIKPNNE